MRIAISGAHGCGKSTLIDAFLARHGDYVHEPEAYEALQDVVGEAFAAEPSADDFVRQLEYQIGRLQEYHPGDRVIFERSPVDYVAYLLALDDLERETADAELTRRSIAVARNGVGLLDVIVYARVRSGGGPESEDPMLRRAVAGRLDDLLLDDDLDLFEGSQPRIVEAIGSTAERLRILEAALR